MVITAMMPRMNSRGDKSTLLGGAGKGGGSGETKMVGGGCSMKKKEGQFVFSCFLIYYY